MQKTQHAAALGRWARGLGLAVGATLLASTQALAHDKIAVLTHRAPASLEYTLHGTVPIPPGTWDGDRSQSVLAIENQDGSLADTQMEVVTRSATGEPEVVEVIARVRRSAAAQPGDRLEYNVVRFAKTQEAQALTPEVRALIDQPGELVLRTYDVFGNAYESDVLRDQHIETDRVLKDGLWIRQTVGHEVLQPTESADLVTALPHMMGVHAYLTTYHNAPYIGLDLVVHNALNGLDEEADIDDLLDHIYFRSLSLDVPTGWVVLTMFENPLESEQREANGGANTVIDLIQAQPLGKMHLLPRQGRFMRRMMLVQDDPLAIAKAWEVLNREDLATLARPRHKSDLKLWSWWNPATAFYFPQKFVLPVLSDFDLPSISAVLDQRFEEVQNQVATGSGGTYPFTSAASGWFHPWGEPYGGGPGGDEIHFVDGLRTLATENIRGYRLAEFAAKSYMDRQPMAFYNADGDPLRLRDLMKVDAQGRFYAPCHFQLVPSGFQEYPRFDLTNKSHAQMVLKLGLQPEYQSTILGWNCVDIQHLTRYTRNFKTLAWLGNDSIAKDELRLVAEIYRLSYHEVYSSADGYVQGSGMLDKLLYVQEYPGKGVGVGRGEAWGMDAACAAYAFSGPEFRTRFRPWFELFSQVLELGQSDCTGNIEAFVIWNYFNGRYTVRQSFETSMIEQSIRSITETVFKGVNELRYQNLRQVQALSTYATMNEPFWDPVQRAPWFVIATGSRDPQLIPDLCFNVPKEARLPHVDYTDYWNAIAYTYANTGDRFLFQRIQTMLDSAQAALGTDQLNFELRLEARAAMLYLMETPLPE